MGRLPSLPPHSREVPVAEVRADAETADGGRATSSSGPDVNDSDAVSVDAQAGVQAEATAKVWTVHHIILAYVLIWVIYFVDSLQQGTTGGLLIYVTSEFSQHSLTAATGIMSNLLGGLLKLPLAKVLDIWGRPQGFAFSTFLLTIGLIMMAACQNVQTYAAAQVFYWVGYNGTSYSLSVFIADTSALKNRALMFAFLTSPYIITTWIGGPLATSFLGGIGWRWAFGVFAIVTPIMSLPLVVLFSWNFSRAKALGLVPEKRSGRTVAESARYYFVQFDVIGLLLIAGGLALFLLPFSLYSYQAERWRSPMIICMLVFGVVLVVAFVLYEKFVAPVQFVPYALLVDRTIMGAMVLAAVVFIAFYIWDSYFSSFLQVVNNLSLTDATYVMRVYTIASCVWGLVVGLLVRVTGRFKWLALYVGVPFTLLGTGLLIHFRQPHSSVGLIIMCHIFIAVGGGAISICEQIAVMASVSHQHIAVILAVQSLFYSVGGAIGSTVAAALWTGIFPSKLAEYLPSESQGNLTSIYGSVVVQLSYPVGSPTREAINLAYGETQKIMLITAVCVQTLAIVCVAVWRDIRVKDFKQVKGLVV